LSVNTSEALAHHKTAGELLSALVARGELSTEDESFVARGVRFMDLADSMLGSFLPAQFSGNAIFFRALINDPLSPAVSVEQWRKHIAGSITVHDIPARHEDLMASEHQATIGKILDGAMADAIRGLDR